MNGKIITLCVLALLTIPILTVTANNNAPPNTPIITGVTNGIIGEIYDYSISSADPDGDDVYYKIVWGDCMIINNAGPYQSGEKINQTHSWSEENTYLLRVKAKDENDHETRWSEPLRVTLQKSKIWDHPILNWILAKITKLIDTIHTLIT